jgi:hypothetical protein
MVPLRHHHEGLLHLGGSGSESLDMVSREYLVFGAVQHVERTA